jgi:hypothetical protein
MDSGARDSICKSRASDGTTDHYCCYNYQGGGIAENRCFYNEAAAATFYPGLVPLPSCASATPVFSRTCVGNQAHDLYGVDCDPAAAATPDDGGENDTGGDCGGTGGDPGDGEDGTGGDGEDGTGGDGDGDTAPDLSLPTTACVGNGRFTGPVDRFSRFTECCDPGDNTDCYGSANDRPLDWCAVATQARPCCYSVSDSSFRVLCFDADAVLAGEATGDPPTGAAACYAMSADLHRYCVNYPRIQRLLALIADHLGKIPGFNADAGDLARDGGHMAAGWVGTVIGKMIVDQVASDAVRREGHRLVLTLAPGGNADPGRRRRNTELEAKDCEPAPSADDGGVHFTDDTDVVAVTNAGTGVTLGVFYCPCNVELPPDNAVIEYVRHGTCFRTAAAEDGGAGDADGNADNGDAEDGGGNGDGGNGGGGGSSDGSSDDGGGGGLSDGEVAGIVVGGVAGAVVVGLGIQRVIVRRGYSNVPSTDEGVSVSSGNGAMVY